MLQFMPEWNYLLNGPFIDDACGLKADVVVDGIDTVNNKKDILFVWVAKTASF